jgi:hypothetical protein
MSDSLIPSLGGAASYGQFHLPSESATSTGKPISFLKKKQALHLTQHFKPYFSFPILFKSFYTSVVHYSYEKRYCYFLQLQDIYK